MRIKVVDIAFFMRIKDIFNLLILILIMPSSKSGRRQIAFIIT